MGTVNFSFMGWDNLVPESRRFNQMDVDFFNSKMGLAKAKARLEQTKHNYEIVFTTLPPVGNSQFFGDPSVKYINEVIKPAVPNLIAPNKFTWIFAQNSSGNHMPLTAWMMAHRFGHMTFFNRGDRSSDVGYVEHVDAVVMAVFAMGLQQMCDYDIGDHYHIMSNDDEPACALSRLLMTMRTARTCNLSTSADSASEMLAQYLLTGKVTFLRYAGWKERRDKIAAHYEAREPGYLREFKEGAYVPSYVQNSLYRKVMKQIDKFIDHVANRLSISQIDEYIAATEAMVNVAFAEYVELQKGKAFIW